MHIQYVCTDLQFKRRPVSIPMFRRLDWFHGLVSSEELCLDDERGWYCSVIGYQQLSLHWFANKDWLIFSEVQHNWLLIRNIWCSTKDKKRSRKWTKFLDHMPKIKVYSWDCTGLYEAESRTLSDPWLWSRNWAQEVSPFFPPHTQLPLQSTPPVHTDTPDTLERIPGVSCVMHADKTYISVCGEGHTDLHVCIGPQSAKGRSKAGRAEMSLRALEL